MNTINEVKMLVAKKGLTLTYLAGYLKEITGKDYNVDKLSKKLRANTIRYEEMKIIANALNMNLVFIDKEQSLNL